MSISLANEKNRVLTEKLGLILLGAQLAGTEFKTGGVFEAIADAIDSQNGDRLWRCLREYFPSLEEGREGCSTRDSVLIEIESLHDNMLAMNKVVDALHSLNECAEKHPERLASTWDEKRKELGL